MQSYNVCTLDLSGSVHLNASRGQDETPSSLLVVSNYDGVKGGLSGPPVMHRPLGTFVVRLRWITLAVTFICFDAANFRRA